MYGAPVGTIKVTASSQIIPKDYKARLFNVNFMTSGTSTTVQFYSGGTAPGTLVIQEQNSSGTPKTVDYGVNGYLFDNGIYIQLDAQASYATVQVRQEEKNNP